MDKLKLVALDPEDLAVVSAHLQDAVLRVADIAWLAKEKRFALVCNRFDWEAAGGGQRLRRRTGLNFGRVLNVRHRLPEKSAESVLNLLAVTFEESEAPSGAVTLVFSGGGAIRLEVECLECEMRDLGPMWETPSTPRHESGDT